MRYILISLFLLFLQFSIDAIAAPLPTTGSSALNSVKWNSAFSQMGFSFKLVSDEWIFLDNPLNNHNQLYQIDLGFKSLSETARLSLKTDTVKTNLDPKSNVENYVKKYLRDYNQYGYEVLTTKSVVINNTPAIIVDLKQKNNLTSSRQVFFGVADKIILANCLEKTEIFSMTSGMCDQLLNGFTRK